MAKLLYKAASRGIMPSYTGKLLAAFSPSRQAYKKAAGEIVEPLSSREMEVLQLIAEGLSNKEVADKIYLSLRTVKWHATNIYAKLGVKNRTQAVAKARTLGILPAFER
jgi:LuxR family maltose regulon positive regulatory protein